MVREEWTAEVFDNDMIGVGVDDWDGEMLKLLKIGMCCCEWEVGKRWGLKEALERIEELSERGHNFEGEDDEYYSSYGSEKDLRSSSFHRRSDDESSFLN